MVETLNTYTQHQSSFNHVSNLLHGRSITSLLLPIALLATRILDIEDALLLKPTNL